MTLLHDLYAELHLQLLDSHIISDSWVDGNARFDIVPHVISQKELSDLYSAAERIGEAMNEAATLIWNSPELLDSYFIVTPYQKLMWLSAGGFWHVIARLDLFMLTDGTIRMCEINADTPSGEAETVLLNRIFAGKFPEYANPNGEFEETFYRFARELAETITGSCSTVGIVYPTDIPEDLSMVLLYKQLFERHGHTVVLGSPYNIRRAASGKIALFGSEIDLLIRHYKTDWWGERHPVWKDADDYPDPDPIEPQLSRVLNAHSNGHTAVVNPFGAVVVQNKFMMAFMHDYKHLFTPETREVIEAFIPKTRRLVDVQQSDLRREEWVLKSVYGCEGDEVIIGAAVSDEEWNRCLEMALPEHWIVQQYFEARRHEGRIANYGVYLLGGTASGIYTRLSIGATDGTSLSAATLVETQSINNH